MKRIRGTCLLSALLLAAFASRSLAQEPASASGAGLKAELLAELTGVEKKLVDLAQAVPAEKYGWRPGDGVRSVSEVYMHVAGANFMLPSLMGVKPPEGIDPGMEKTVTDRAKVVEMVKKSFDHTRKAVESTPLADFDKKIKYFGREGTVRSLFLLLVNHAHEHMGQSIAYARINGVTPPWSAVEEKPAPKEPKGTKG